MTQTGERYLTVRELDAHLLNGRRIDVTRAGGYFVNAQPDGLCERVPAPLFEIYLRNGLIGRDDGRRGFVATPLGRSRLRRR
jgi:hypothetical protein